MKFDFKSESLKRKFGLNLFSSNLIRRMFLKEQGKFP